MGHACCVVRRKFQQLFCIDQGEVLGVGRWVSVGQMDNTEINFVPISKDSDCVMTDDLPLLLERF